VTAFGSGGSAGAGLLRRSVALILASSSSTPKGLGHIVVRAQVERADLVGLGPARRQHDDAYLGQLADLPAQLEAVGVRQYQVQEHYVGDAELEGSRDGIAAHRDDHVVAAHGQVGPDEVDDVLVVLHDQDDGLVRQSGTPCSSTTVKGKGRRVGHRPQGRRAGDMP